MFHTFIVKYGEIGIKGKNRYLFEEALVKRIRQALHGTDGDFDVTWEQGRIYVERSGSFDYDETIQALQKVFGIVGISPVKVVEENSLPQISEEVVRFLQDTYKVHDQSFKIVTRRAKKSYPIPSMEVSSEIGGKVLEAFPDMHVDVHTPQLEIHVEIRDQVYIYSETIPGPGGMPVGTNGSAMLLLSGGIDSPVAG